MSHAWVRHTRLVRVGFTALADLAWKGMILDDEATPASFLQAHEQQVCQPCVVGKLPLTYHPTRHTHPGPTICSIRI